VTLERASGEENGEALSSKLIAISHLHAHFHSHFHSHSCSFRIDNTDHIFDVNKKQNDHDQVDLVCPQQQQQQQPNTMVDAQNRTTLAQTQTGGGGNGSGSQERYVIYSVSVTFSPLVLRAPEVRQRPLVWPSERPASRLNGRPSFANF